MPLEAPDSPPATPDAGVTPKALVVVDAPGKVSAFAHFLAREPAHNPWAGARVASTFGHLCRNPDSLKPVGIQLIDGRFVEAARLPNQTVRERLHAAVSAVRTVFIATDDDDEGDVIAYDLWSLMPQRPDLQYWRVRLGSLSRDGLRAGFINAERYDPRSPEFKPDHLPGAARRVTDRLIGAHRSTSGIPQGRVFTALLGALSRGEALTHEVVLRTATGFTATRRVPTHEAALWRSRVFMAADLPEPAQVLPARLPPPRPLHFASAVELILDAVPELNGRIRDAAALLQKLYMDGQITYTRTASCGLTNTGIASRGYSLAGCELIANLAIRNHLTINSALPVHTTGRHESIRITEGVRIDVSAPAQNRMRSPHDRALAAIALRCIQTGIAAPAMVAALTDRDGWPDWAHSLSWFRPREIFDHYAQIPRDPAGVHLIPDPRALLRLIAEQQLGRPSTCVAHVEQVLNSGLFQDGVLTPRGWMWVERSDPALMIPGMAPYMESRFAQAVEDGGIEDAVLDCLERIERAKKPPATVGTPRDRVRAHLAELLADPAAKFSEISDASLVTRGDAYASAPQFVSAAR